MQELKEKHREVMQEMLMDVLRALSAPNMDIRKKTLDIALDLITARNIDEVGSFTPTDLLLESVSGGGALAGQPASSGTTFVGACRQDGLASLSSWLPLDTTYTSARSLWT